MTVRLAILFTLVPAMAAAQGNVVDAARAARDAEAGGSRARARAADAALVDGATETTAARSPARSSRDAALTPAPDAASPGEDARPTGVPEPTGDFAEPGTAPGGRTHTVQRGDTLWDLSARFLGNPWYWPKVWSYNPQIANPHFIYPGNVVRLRATGDASGRLEVVSSGDEDLEAPRELDDLSRADMKRPQEIGDGDDVAVVGPYRIGYVAPRALLATRESFVTQQEMEQSGTITSAFEDKLLLTNFDRAYAKFADPSKVRVGERYRLYRTERPVRHPVTHELFGYQTSILGTATVVAIDANVATVEISQARGAIERGALIAPWGDSIVKRVERRPNQRLVDGVILAAQRDVVSEVGEHHVVFVDKGRSDGVEDGNVFTVLRSGDPYGIEIDRIAHDASLPDEDIGTLLVVDAQQNSSAALVVRSIRELYVGDRVEMRPQTAAASSAGARLPPSPPGAGAAR